MFFVLEGFKLWRLVFVVDATFSAITIDIGKLVDRNSVSSIQRCAMKQFRRRSGLLCSVKFDESKSVRMSASQRCASRSKYPSDMSSSFIGIKMASSRVLPAVLSFLRRNLTSLGFCSELTSGRPSIT